jgi:hypothetical protein
MSMASEEQMARIKYLEEKKFQRIEQAERTGQPIKPDDLVWYRHKQVPFPIFYIFIVILHFLS